MDHVCEGSGRELDVEPPSAEATTCPECGRETTVDGQEVDGVMRFTIAHHDRVVRESP
jgi:hypothetical protein